MRISLLSPFMSAAMKAGKMVRHSMLSSKTGVTLFLFVLIFHHNRISGHCSFLFSFPNAVARKGTVTNPQERGITSNMHSPDVHHSGEPRVANQEHYNTWNTHPHVHSTNTKMDYRNTITVQIILIHAQHCIKPTDLHNCANKVTGRSQEVEKS